MSITLNAKVLLQKPKAPLKFMIDYMLQKVGVVVDFSLDSPSSYPREKWRKLRCESTRKNIPLPSFGRCAFHLNAVFILFLSAKRFIF